MESGDSNEDLVRVTWKEYDENPAEVMQKAAGRQVLVDDADGSTSMLLDCSPIRDEDLLGG